MTAKTSVDDAQLIRQIVRGDRQALSELYVRHQRALFSYLLQFTQTGSFLLVPLGLFCYVVIVLPGMFFVAAFSIACPAVIWVPLYQFLFFGYWFWGNLLSPSSGLPTLNGTILTPIGSVIGASFFGISSFRGVVGPSPAIDGVASIVALLGLATLVLVALYQFLKWKQARQ
jgi:ABC-2 type transport system permease protein